MASIIIVSVFMAVAMCAVMPVLPKFFRQEAKTAAERKKEELDTVFWFLFVLLIGFVIRLIAAVKYYGFESDVNCFVAWSDMVYNDGFHAFYLSDAFHDYPPGYMYVLYVCAALRKMFGVVWNSGFSLFIMKSPAILADLATGVILFQVARKHFSKAGASLVASLYLLSPAIILDSAFWGQTDAVFTLFVVLMCYFVSEKKLIPAYFVFAFGILIKPQTLIFTPVLIYAIIDQVFLEDFNVKKFTINLCSGIVAIGMIGLLMLPFGFNLALAQYRETLGSYEYATVNAFNLWNLLGKNWTPQTDTLFGITFQTWGSIFIVLTVITSALIFFRAKKNPAKYYFVAGYIVTCMFLFSVRMHERYIFPAMILFLLAYTLRPKKPMMITYILFSAFSYMNMAFILFKYDVSNFNPKEPIGIVTSLGMLGSFAYLIYVIVKEFSPKAAEEKVGADLLAEKRNQFNKMNRNEKKKANLELQKQLQKKSPIVASKKLAKITKIDIIIILVISVVYGIVAFARLGQMSAPETEYSLVNQGEVVLDMGQEVTVSQLWNFLGHENNPQYYIDYTNDINAGWSPLYFKMSEGATENDSNLWDAGNVFAWNRTDLNATARYFKITPTENNYSDSFMEWVLLDPEGNLLMPANAPNYQTLFDEQDLFDEGEDFMNSSYFDEIYHARTAYEMIHHLYCYENTHPPLGKEFIALGVLIFGMNPFGWRFMGTLFGVIMLPFMYLLCKRFFKETWIATATTILFAFDFMHFVQTRIATIDVFVTLFIIMSYYFMYCYLQTSFYDTKLTKTWIPLGLCGISMGLSWASKWTGIYASAGLCILFFAHMLKRYLEFRYAVMHPGEKTGEIEHDDIRKKFVPCFWKTIVFCLIFFVAIPVGIYLLSYIPFSDGSDRGLIAKVISAQKTMFDYHSQLEADHPYSSYWYQWPTMRRPMWYYSRVLDNGLREGLSAFGNPLVWWAGIPAFAYMLYLIARYRDKNAIFLSIGYLSQYAPWFVVTRVVFIYHYFPSVPFVTVMVGYMLYRFSLVPQTEKNRRIAKYAVFGYVVAAVILFIMFYPVLSGYPIHVEYAEKYLKWFDTWVLIDNWS